MDRGTWQATVHGVAKNQIPFTNKQQTTMPNFDVVFAPVAGHTVIDHTVHLRHVHFALCQIYSI